MLRSRWSAVRTAVSVSLLALLSVLACNHGSSPARALLPVGISALLASSGAPPSGVVVHPQPPLEHPGR